MLTPVRLGSLIGGAFGLVFVLVNTASLPDGAALALRTLACLAFAGIVAAVVVGSRRDAAAGPREVTPTGGLGRAYWTVVAIEFLAIAVGVNVLSGPLERPEAGVGWVSLVVGVHFLALALLWSQPLFHLLGAALSLCGAASLVLVFAGAGLSAVDLLGGVLPGALLLAFGLWGSTHPAAARTSASS